MTYASFDAVIKRYSQDILINLAGMVKGYDENIEMDALKTKIDTALLDASEEIDLYLNKRYKLPLTNIPKQLLEACIDLAVWRLPQGDAEHNKTIKDKCAFWRKLLEDIASGKKDLVSNAGSELTSNDGDIVMVIDSISSLDMKGY